MLDTSSATVLLPSLMFVESRGGDVQSMTLIKVAFLEIASLHVLNWKRRVVRPGRGEEEIPSMLHSNKKK